MLAFPINTKGIYMSFEVEAVAIGDLPFKPDHDEPDDRITIQSTADEDAIADGETGPFPWMDLRDVPDAFSLLIDPEEIVLTAPEVNLVLSYPLKTAAVRILRPADANSFTRGQLIRAIDETYRAIYKMESETQSAPTPPVEERVRLLNRPSSDGTFGIWGHDINDLGIGDIDIYKAGDKLWLDPYMQS